MLTNFPAELLDAIIAHLPADRHVNSLAQTSRHLYLAVNPSLYRRKPYALSWAAENGRITTAQLALNGCPDLDLDEAASNTGESILSLAAKNGHKHMVEWLLAKNIIHVNHRDEATGRTALIHAIGEGHIDIIKTLLAHPYIDVNLQATGFPYSPFGLAVEIGNEHVVKLLLQVPNIEVDVRDGAGNTPLMHAADAGAVSIVKLLLDTGKVEDGSDDFENIPPAAWLAALTFSRYGKPEQLEVLKLLLDDPNARPDYRGDNGDTFLIWTARTGLLDVVKIIIKSGKFDIGAANHAGATAFSCAAGSSLQVMKCLYQTGEIDINKPETGFSPIRVAIRSNYRWSVEWLLSLDGLDVEARDRSGYTLLEHAVCNDLPDMVDALLTSPKIDPNTKNKHGETPLHRAAIQGNDKLVKRLVDSPKVDVNAGDKRGRTAISWAVEMGFNAVTMAILTSGRADILKADLDGVTPLALAKRNRSSVCVQLMWNSGLLDFKLEQDGSTEARRPLDHRAQEYIDKYLTEDRLQWAGQDD
ncbi:ankyrin repeats (3 copies) domain-containing protein [Pochonia chlamydosporia 170]|uniref:Ankyrin repeats (3 copies) domain-containing protein n=1 Tax=Pochonia chlamydosporia 170 TaxID=1380566 RepID=A0A179FPL9_METCM|nr:ankyrin repeats (3 copies) domain-containing protein [Pochonia chlamydosporia 170]OAQ67317.1 ankyrin repeats (3 copies) domain-containing protein [Pochonia chlamydosporia 170]